MVHDPTVLSFFDTHKPDAVFEADLGLLFAVVFSIC